MTVKSKTEIKLRWNRENKVLGIKKNQKESKTERKNDSYMLSIPLYYTHYHPQADAPCNS